MVHGRNVELQTGGMTAKQQPHSWKNFQILKESLDKIISKYDTCFRMYTV